RLLATPREDLVGVVHSQLVNLAYQGFVSREGKNEPRTTTDHQGQHSRHNGNNTCRGYSSYQKEDTCPDDGGNDRTPEQVSRRGDPTGLPGQHLRLAQTR